MKSQLAAHPSDFVELPRELGKHRFMGGTCVDCGKPLDMVCTANLGATPPSAAGHNVFNPEAKTFTIPTPDEIDAEIAFYNNAQECLRAAQKTADDYKQRLVFLADSFGTRPDGAEQSLRLAGRRNTLTVTRGRTIDTCQDAIGNLMRWCKRRGHANIFALMFAPEVRYVLLQSWRDVLKNVTLSKRAHASLSQLVALCIDVKVKAPSVKIEVIQPAKPTRKPRAGRAAA